MLIELWTDGSGTVDGPGGWAFVLRAVDANGELIREVVKSGHEPDTTNNRMEMTALLMGLRELKIPTPVHIFTDSEYVMKAWTDNWLGKWQRKDWHKVKNVDLWKALLEAAMRHTLEFHHVRGHTGVELNEKCDRLAGQARQDAMNAELGFVVHG